MFHNMPVQSNRHRKEVIRKMSDYMTSSDVRKMERDIREQHKEKRSKEIARKMKSLNMFSDSFICEITGVKESYLKKM